jgi:transcription termination factor Rho
VTLVNGAPVEQARQRPEFTRLTAVHPTRVLQLEGAETPGLRGDTITGRLIDLIAPLGFGQRALVVAPAKAGKTTVLQTIAAGVARNHPETQLFILLVDERPEEVGEMEMIGVGEVVASSFDHPAERHVAVAELVIERARRRVEEGGDAVIILDSITRLARAWNTVERGTGRTLSGGLDAQALENPKRLLGSARQVDPSRDGGSLTIIATALIDTGSKMDQVIFEEFKGTGNSELVLSRELAERRIYPAIDLRASGTRREELLLAPDALEAVRQLRAGFAALTPADAMQRMITELKRYKTNEEFIRSFARTPARS